MKYKLPTIEYIARALSLSVDGTYDNTLKPLSINAFNFYNFTNWRSAEGYPIPPNPAEQLPNAINNSPLIIPSNYTPQEIQVIFEGNTTPILIGYEYILKFQQGNSVNWDITIDTDNNILITTAGDTTITATVLGHYDSTNDQFIPLFYISHDDIIINSTRIVYFHIKNEFYVPQYYLQQT